MKISYKRIWKTILIFQLLKNKICRIILTKKSNLNLLHLLINLKDSMLAIIYYLLNLQTVLKFQIASSLIHKFNNN